MALTHPLPEPLIELIAQRFRALGEPMRIRILERLREAPSTVGELAAAVDTSQQNVSKHLSVLSSVGIVTRRREGTTAWYEIGDETVLRICDEVCGAVQKQVAELHQLLGEGAAR